MKFVTIIRLRGSRIWSGGRVANAGRGTATWGPTGLKPGREALRQVPKPYQGSPWSGWGAAYGSWKRGS